MNAKRALLMPAPHLARPGLGRRPARGRQGCGSAPIDDLAEPGQADRNNSKPHFAVESGWARHTLAHALPHIHRRPG